MRWVSWPWSGDVEKREELVVQDSVCDAVLVLLILLAALGFLNERDSSNVSSTFAVTSCLAVGMIMMEREHRNSE